ncbi:hypothetical protein OW763_13295 [Clostridium aestuarii]|uniref:Lipoprotein n=1 Tax=Clostridium aestuarii TaxID=338193 RepID=A0ABT4D241_9CLOT|nr:hypothetical protein [Clostridium aestuarii]MCY6485309.1 hypothetical protein [Clostridium aestuarii]
MIKSIVKKIVCFMAILVLSISVVGCSPKVKSGDGTDSKEYSEELAKYFPLEKGIKLYYCGTLEYAHALTLSEIEDKKEKLILKFKGKIVDVSEGEGGATEEDLLIDIDYIIGKDSIIEKNKKIKEGQLTDSEKTILKEPIVVGTAWNQKITLEGKEYEAETKIVDVSKDKENKDTIKTETIIKGIDNYPESTYKEILTYKEGKGLVEFTKTLPLYETEQGKQSYGFDFEYHLFKMELPNSENNKEK